MKSTCIFIVTLCLLGLALADTSKFQSKLTSLLNAKAKSADAVDSVLGLLNDLAESNRKEQAAADEANRTHEENGRNEINSLTEIRNGNEATLKASVAHTAFVEAEIKDTEGVLNWIHNRVNEIDTRKEQLYDQRCYSNSMFVKSIKEHRDALTVLEELKAELQPYGNKVGLSQISDITSKLQAYSHLFNKAALDKFLQLSEPQTNFDSDQRHVDNDRGNVAIAPLDNNIAGRKVGETLGDRTLALVDQLIEHLKQSLVNLENNEVKAAYDFASWLTASEKELRDLAADEKRKSEYLKKLEIDLEIAAAEQDRRQKIFDDSVVALNNAIDSLNRKREYYANETERRKNEANILRDVIDTFKNRVNGLSDFLRNRVEDWNADKDFDVDAQRDLNPVVARDSGRLYDNVKQAAASL